jgi:hypothetical protein
MFQNIPPDLSQCVFVIEQALSVRALQELVTAAGSETVGVTAWASNRTDMSLSCCERVPNAACIKSHLFHMPLHLKFNYTIVYR